MKIHFRFFLSYDNSSKISIFHEKSMYFEKIPRENRPEASCFTGRHNASSYGFTFALCHLTKKHETGVKSVM